MSIVIIIAIIVVAIFIYSKNKSKNIKLKFNGLEYTDNEGQKFLKRAAQNIILYDHTVVFLGYLNKEYEIINFMNLGSRLKFTIKDQAKVQTLIVELQIEQAYLFEESLGKDSYLFSNLL